MGEPVAGGRHQDIDGDGLADHGLVDQRDEHALDDEATDPEQRQPDRWVGVTRDPVRVPEPEVTR